MLPDKYRESAYQKWQEIFARRRFAPDAEPGHLAWRTVVLHRRRMPTGGTLLDAGFGGGEDLVFCAGRGYAVTGLEFSENALARTRELLVCRKQSAKPEYRALGGQAAPEDPTIDELYDVVLFSNVSQDLGADARSCLEALKRRVRPGGVFGASVMSSISNLPKLSDCFTPPGWEWIERISIEQRQGTFDLLITARSDGR